MQSNEEMICSLSGHQYLARIVQSGTEQMLGDIKRLLYSLVNTDDKQNLRSWKFDRARTLLIIDECAKETSVNIDVNEDVDERKVYHEKISDHW